MTKCAQCIYYINMSTTLNIRIDEKIKKKAIKTLSSLGIDMSTAVKIFLNQVIIEQGMPFVPTKDPARINAKWDRQIEYAIKHGKSYKSAEDLFDDIL